MALGPQPQRLRNSVQRQSADISEQPYGEISPGLPLMTREQRQRLITAKIKLEKMKTYVQTQVVRPKPSEAKALELKQIQPQMTDEQRERIKAGKLKLEKMRTYVDTIATESNDKPALN